MKRLALFLLCVCLWSVEGSTQPVTLVFPQENARVTASDLTLRGFEWLPVEGATEYQVTVLSNDLLQPQPFPPIMEITGSSVQLEAEVANVMRPDRYFWQVTITAGTGAGSSTVFLPFELLPPGEDLIPTPTPEAPPVFQGDFDGSQRVDAVDLLLYAQHWNQTTDDSTSEFDLNADGVINALDLLKLVRRYGSDTPIVDPDSPVGPVQAVAYAPANPIQINQLAFFELTWEAPAFPVQGTFTYDVLIDSQTGFRTHFPNLTEPRLRPFPNGFTQIGPYVAYIRATDENGVRGAVVTSTFEVTLSQGGTLPTPTPGVNPDLPAPTWEQVVIDSELLNDPLLGPSPCAGEVGSQTIPFNGLFLYTFPTLSEQCQISGIRATQFLYENLDAATGYEISIVEPSGNVFSYVVDSYQPVQFIRFLAGEYQLSVRARFAGNQTGPWSPTLLVTIPATEE